MSSHSSLFETFFLPIISMSSERIWYEFLRRQYKEWKDSHWGDGINRTFIRIS